MAANVETMMYVREKPWHGLGVEVSEAPNSEDALRFAGLDWNVRQENVFNSRGGIIKGFKANVRDSDDSVLGVVGDRYKVVQNRDAFKFTDELIGTDIRYETAGSLREGKQIWLLAKLPEQMIAGDAVEPYRSGEVSIIQAQVVYEHDSFNYSFGLEPVLKHIPAASDRGEPTYVYAMFRTKEGGFGFDVMSMDAVRIFAQQYSKSFSSGPWQRNFEEMAKKTVLKKVLKYAPLKSDFQRGLALDGTIKADVGEDMYAVPGTVLEVDSETGEVTEVGPEA